MCHLRVFLSNRTAYEYEIVDGHTVRCTSAGSHLIHFRGELPMFGKRAASVSIGCDCKLHSKLLMPWWVFFLFHYEPKHRLVVHMHARIMQQSHH